MTILCIDTSTSVCSAAICKDGVPMNQCICREGSNHARLLPRYIQQLLLYAQTNNLTIDAIALSEGPGSYTGLRIGTSMAKGLCFGLNVPLIPVPTLRLLASIASFNLSPLTSHLSPLLLCPMIDARRMEVYTALYDANLNPLTPTRAVVVEDEKSLLTDDQTIQPDTEIYFFGDGAEKCRHILSNPHWHYLPNIIPDACRMADGGEKILDNTRDILETAYYEPYYLKDFVAAQSHVKGLK